METGIDYPTKICLRAALWRARVLVPSESQPTDTSVESCPSLLHLLRPLPSSRSVVASAFGSVAAGVRGERRRARVGQPIIAAA